jgi:hypothetical protein
MSNTPDNTNNSNQITDKKKTIAKLVAVVAVGVACLFGCCDVDCLLFNIRAFFGS